VKRALLSSLILLAGCSTVQIRFHTEFDRRAPAQYEDYFDSYLFGIVGENDVNVQQVCVDQTPLGLIRRRTLTDVSLAVLTLGIYTPFTVRVWCGDVE
jgi:Bor protein